MARRLAALEASADAAHDEHAGAAAELAAKLAYRAAMLEGTEIDVQAAPIVDLLITGHYAEIVRRVDTWHAWTSADLSPALARLADQLRRLVREGETL
jgi:hypothetical protein